MSKTPKSLQGKIKIDLGDVSIPEEYKKWIKLVEDNEYEGTRRKVWLFDGYFSFHLSGAKKKGARLILGRKKDSEYKALIYFPSKDYSLYELFYQNYLKNNSSATRPGYYWKCSDQRCTHVKKNLKLIFLRI